MKTIVEVQQLYKRYPNASADAVADISFTVKQGEILALLGPNGAGKTTTLKMLLGLLQPDQGKRAICGYDMGKAASRKLGIKQVGAVLEGSRNAYWRISGLENLRYFAGVKGIPRRQARQKADALIELLGLTDVAKREVRHYSRGMQQKLAVAIALLADPSVLLLDEPTLGLDVLAAKLLEEQIEQVAAQGKGVILTTHSMALAERVATHIFVMFNNHQVAYAAKATLLANTQGVAVTEVILDVKLDQRNQQMIHTHFAQLEIALLDKQTVLVWHNPTQTALIALLNLLDKAHLPIHSVNRREPTLEEIFLDLTHNNNA